MALWLAFYPPLMSLTFQKSLVVLFLTKPFGVGLTFYVISALVLIVLPDL